MQVTLDQARALDAFAQAGTLKRAAAQLGKAHTAVLYALKQLELQTGLELFDRSGYRTVLTAAGERVLGHCRELLKAERALAHTCDELKAGWEASLTVVFDGICAAEPLLEAVAQLKAEGAPTRMEVSADFLDGVERRFEAQQAQVMVSLLPSSLPELTQRPLPKLKAHLVAHRGHPLARLKKVTPADLAKHLLLAVRASDPRLGLAEGGEPQSAVYLSDFHAKKAALLKGLGFGWLPDWLAAEELQRKRLVPVRLQGGSTHVFAPTLYARADARGRAAVRLLELLGAG